MSLALVVNSLRKNVHSLSRPAGEKIGTAIHWSLTAVPNVAGFDHPVGTSAPSIQVRIDHQYRVIGVSASPSYGTAVLSLESILPESHVALTLSRRAAPEVATRIW
jgi:hypothetical protein